MIKNINILIFFIFSFTSNGQIDEIGKETSKSFSAVAASTADLALYGYKDGGIEIRLFLSNKDDDWEGICYYPSSDEKLKLEGGMIDGKLILDEFDRDNNTIGMWMINMDSAAYKARWRNVAGSKLIDIQFHKLKNKPENNRTKAVFYKGQLLNDDFEIVLINNPDNTLTGNFINLRQKEYLKNDIKCLDSGCDTFVVNIQNSDIKKLLCNKNADGSISVVTFDNSGTQFKSELTKINELVFENKSYINKKYSLNISYPVFENEKLNKSFNNELDLLIDSLEEEMEKIFFDKNDYDNRLTLQANGWFDIDYYSNDIFSARFFIQKSYSDITDCYPVNFNIKAGKKINIQDQFSSDFNYDFYRIQFLRESIKLKHLSRYKSIMIRNYLKPENFKYVTFNSAGLVFSTGFNTLFGTYKIVIPYYEIKDKIKRRSIFKKIIKS